MKVQILPAAVPVSAGQTRIAEWLGDSMGRWNGDTLVVDTTTIERLCESAREQFYTKRPLTTPRHFETMDGGVPVCVCGGSNKI